MVSTKTPSSIVAFRARPLAASDEAADCIFQHRDASYRQVRAA
jgi:hypothetical protein